MRRLWAGIALVLGIGVLFWRDLPGPGMTATPETTRNVTTTSRSLALTGDGLVLLVVNPDANSLTLIDTGFRSVLAEIPVGIDPRAVALSGTRAYVASQGSDRLDIIDLSSRRAIATRPVGDRPVGVAVSPDGRFLAVAELGQDTVRTLDAASLVTLSRHRVLDRPHGLSYTPDGRYLLVTHLLSGNVTRLAVLPFRQYLPAVGLKAGSSLRPAPPAGRRTPSGAPDALVTVIATWPQVAPAPAVLVNAAGTRAYLPQTMANGQGFNTQFDNSVFPRVTVIDLATWRHASSELVSLPETDRPVGLPWDAGLAQDDSELWVLNAASNDVSVVDISQPGAPRRRAHIPVGDNPRGIVLDPLRALAYVNNTLAGTVSVIDTRTYTVTIVITVTELPLPPLLLTGKRLFHSSARPELSRAAWISCNTCHVEGEHDGRTWRLPFLGPVPPGAVPVITRNTTSLLGMIETYPLRWSAEWDESADSEFSLRFEQFGRGLIDGDMHPPLGPPNQGRSAELDALAAYIDSLLLPRRQHYLSPAERRGRAIFAAPETGCLSCHPPPLYTDLQTHDVGTANAADEWLGPAIDTPSLRFLHDSAPYLHDGSAPTLLDVLTTRNPADDHGLTSQLTGAELADLIAYLLVVPYE